MLAVRSFALIIAKEMWNAPLGGFVIMLIVVKQCVWRNKPVATPSTDYFVKLTVLRLKLFLILKMVMVI